MYKLKKYLVFVLVGFIMQGCVAKDQDMYAEDALTDRYEREKDVDYAVRNYIAPVVGVPGAIIVGTIQGAGEVVKYTAAHPELVQQGIKTYQQVEYEQRRSQQRADKAYNEMQATLQEHEDERRRTSAKTQQQIQENRNGSLGYSSSTPQPITYNNATYSNTRTKDYNNPYLTEQSEVNSKKTGKVYKTYTDIVEDSFSSHNKKSALLNVTAGLKVKANKFCRDRGWEFAEIKEHQPYVIGCEEIHNEVKCNARMKFGCYKYEY